MKMVEAKCIMEAWDSIECLPYKPGAGPLPGGLYEIDRDGPLALLKTPRGKFVFEFKRGVTENAATNDEPENQDAIPAVSSIAGKNKGKTFTCKTEGCSKVFPNLNALKIHKKSHDKDAVTKAA